jgi:photosystem II stability/assembly factor-like uncharacterized protein
MKKIILAVLACGWLQSASAQWTLLTTGTTDTYNDLAFTDPMTGTAVGRAAADGSGVVLRTTDGGSSWSAATVNQTGLPSFNAIAFATGNTGWIVGNSGRVLQSSNAGASWDTIPRFTTKNLYTVYFMNSVIGFAGGADGVLYRTQNGGTSWDTLQSGTSLPIQDFFLVNASTAFYTGDGGVIAKTTNGGDSWTLLTQPYFGFFNGRGIAGTSAQDFYAVGQYGYGVSTADTGTTWNSFTTGTNQELSAIGFVNSISGISCGNSGTILTTTNGGNSWSVDTSGVTAANLLSITFSDATTAFICGQSGTILKSTADISNVQSASLTPLLVQAWPNPFQEQLQVKFVLEETSEVQIHLYDVTGRLLVQYDLGTLLSGEQQFTFNSFISDLQSGLYFIQIDAGKQAVSLPVVRY